MDDVRMYILFFIACLSIITSINLYYTKFSRKLCSIFLIISVISSIYVFIEDYVLFLIFLLIGGIFLMYRFVINKRNFRKMVIYCKNHPRAKFCRKMNE